MTTVLTRREMLQAAVLALGATPALLAQESKPEPKKPTTAEEYMARLEVFYHETDARPEFIWMNREDVMYHDLDYPSVIGEAPEYCCFLRKAWVFNRALQWVRDNGAILCYEAAGELPLTGEKQVSAWFTGKDNQVIQEGEFTRFEKHSRRYRDCLVLPAFQFHAGQHPVLALEVDEANTDWQLVVSLKGRGGRPQIATPWHSGPARAEIDIAAELARRGFQWNFPEVHLAIGTWHPSRSHVSKLRFRARLLPRPAVVACLPVIRTAERAKSEGLPLAAVVVDAQGRRLGKQDVQVRARIGEQDCPLVETDGLWKTQVKDLPVGNHIATILAEGKLNATARTDLRITDGQFYRLEKGQPWLSLGGKPLGPLTGSYQGTFFFEKAGQPGEKLVQTQAAWDAWDRSKPDAEHMHFWESWKAEEIDQRFCYLKQCGWDLLTLHSCWGQWERLDAGGRIAPHAAEQLGRYLRIAGRHGLAHLQGLSSGPYGHPDQKPKYGGTVPYSRYLEEGFQTKHFMEPGTGPRFDELFHQYLEDFATLFRDETALLGMTASGEGDFFNGPARTNDVMQLLRKFDQNHFIPAEAVLMLDGLPSKKTAGYQQQLFGGRTYGIGNNAAPEDDLGLKFKIYHMAGMYMAEGSWPAMPEYNRFQNEVLLKTPHQDVWTGDHLYRRRLRDTLYLGMVNLIPIMNTWDEHFAEDEHLLVRQIRERIDWHTRFTRPRVVIQVDDAISKHSGPARARVAGYEKLFARLGLMYRTIPVGEPAPTDALLVIDGREPFQPLRLKSEGGTLPDALKQEMPLEIHGEYSANFAWSEDRRTLLAYLFNVSDHMHRRIMLGGGIHRIPKPAPLSFRLKNLPDAKLQMRIYDLDTKRVRLETPVKPGAEYDLGNSDHDYFVLVTR
ncbi:MAG: hypothetical protein ABR915_01020 [Thermoguttaceae bacterium]|jgi:hypothetical protein